MPKKAHRYSHSLGTGQRYSNTNTRITAHSSTPTEQRSPVIHTAKTPVFKYGEGMGTSSKGHCFPYARGYHKG